MYLKQNQKVACLQEVRNTLPMLLENSDISVSYRTARELSDIIEEQIRYNYFPNRMEICCKGILGFLTLPFSLIFAAMDFNITIPRQYIETNPELHHIWNNNRRSLKSVSCKIREILYKYEDQEYIAEMAARAREYRHVGNQNLPPSQLQMYDSARDRLETIVDSRSRTVLNPLPRNRR